MSFDIRKSLGCMAAEVMVVATASVACVVSYAGSFWPVVSAGVGSVGCGMMAIHSGIAGFNSDTMTGKIAGYLSSCLLSAAALFYCVAAVDFVNCVIVPPSDVIVYNAIDQCDEVAKEALGNACILFGFGVTCVIATGAVNIINSCRRRGSESIPLI